MSLDGNVSLFGITASVDKLRLTYQVNKPFFEASSWAVDLDGFAVAANVSGLTLVGALRRAPLSPPLQGVEYLGMLKIGFNGYGVDLFGGYAHPTGPQGSFASFFAFGALHAPLGGVPAFFITGIGLGFGINRELAPPTMETITTNPFLVAMKALGPPPEPMAQLETMRTQIQPKQGTYWVAAGISFTSFVLISGEIVLTIEFGDGLDITLLGLARAELPAPGLTLVSIELGLIARFSTTEGVAMVQAQLTENSWLLMKSVRLTGGFAFATWWKGPNAGQFVVTMGGYHPKFNHPGYPVVPRLGLSWKPISNISVVGESYFALCSEALMAGSSFSVSAKFGPAYARLSFGADGIVFFDPFWFSVSAWAEIAAGIKIWLLFGTVTIELSLGAYIEVTGPPIFVKGHFEICGFEVPFEFGDEGNPEDNALTAARVPRQVPPGVVRRAGDPGVVGPWRRRLGAQERRLAAEGAGRERDQPVPRHPRVRAGRHHHGPRHRHGAEARWRLRQDPACGGARGGYRADVQPHADVDLLRRGRQARHPHRHHDHQGQHLTASGGGVPEGRVGRGAEPEGAEGPRGRDHRRQRRIHDQHLAR